MTAFGAIPPADQTALRAQPQGVQTYLTVVPPLALMTARINQAAFAYPLGQIAIDDIVLAAGVALADIPANVDVWIGTFSGARDVFVGRTRLDNSGDVVTADTLYVEEIGSGMSNVPQVAYAELADNLYITVLETSSIYYALPNIVESGGSLVVYQDWNVAYTDQNETPNPVANITFKDGTMPAGFATYRVKVSGETSFEAITGDPVVSYSWNIKDGSLVGGYALSDETIEVDYDQGARWLELTVTDSNAKTHTARFPLVYYDDTHPPFTVFLAEDNRTRKGRTITVTGSPDELTLEDVPHGAMCIVWEKSYPASEYTIDWFVGFALQERGTLGIEQYDMALQIAGPVPFLDHVQQVPTRLEVSASPSIWQEGVQDYVNVPGCMHWLMTWKLPAFLSMFDVRFFPTSGESWQDTNQGGFGSGDIGGTQMGAVFQRLASRLPANFGSTSEGSIVLERDPQYLEDRSGWVTRASLNLTGDFSPPFTYTRDARLSAGQVIADGLIYKTAEGLVPLRSGAPDLTPAQSPGRPALAGMLVNSQIDLNWLSGAEWAMQNQPFTITGLMDFPDVFEPCLMYRVAVTASEADFDRADYGEFLRRLFDVPYDRSTSPVSGGIARNFYVEGVSIERPEGTTQKNIRVTLTPEITSTPGVFLPVPQPSAYPGIGDFRFNLPSLNPIDVNTPGIPTFDIDFGVYVPLGIPAPQTPPLQFAQYSRAEEEVYMAVARGSNIYYVAASYASFIAGTPTWAIRSTLAYDDGDKAFGDFILDPTNKYERALTMKKDAAGNGYTIRVCNNITQAAWTWTTVQSLTLPTQAQGSIPTRMLASKYAPGWFLIFEGNRSGNPLTSNRVWVTTNTWTSAQVVALGTASCVHGGGLAIDRFGNGIIYAGVNGGAYRSANWGATWALRTPSLPPATQFDGAASINYPYAESGGADNDGANAYLVGANGDYFVGPPLNLLVITSTDGFQNAIDAGTGTSHTYEQYAYSVASSPLDGDKLAYAATPTVGAGGFILTSTNGGTSWTSRATPDDANFADSWLNDAGLDVLVFGATDYCRVSPDWGVTLVDASGNLDALLGGSGWTIYRIRYNKAGDQ